MKIVFAYEHQYRVLENFHVKTSAAGNDLLVGVDPDKGEWRSFRVDRIQRGVRIVGDPAAGEDVGVPPGDRTSLPAQARQSRDAVGAP